MRLITLAVLLTAAPAWAQDAAPVSVRFLRTEKGQTPLPPMVHLRVELNNPAKEPRWVLVALGRESRLPKDGRFAVDSDGLPVFALEAKNDSGRATMIGFVGEPRFMAFLLPAEAKATFEDFELPSTNDLTEIDWMEAKTLKADRTLLEKWLPTELTSSAGAKFGKDQSWTDLLRDDKGEPRGDLPRDKISAIVADVSRAGRISVEGYTTPARYFQAIAAKEALKDELPPGWSLVAAFQPVRPLKVEHLAFTPDDGTVIASLQTYKVVGLELGKNRERVFPMGEKSLARFFAFSPEGNLLVKQAAEPLEEDANLDLADWTAGKVLDVLRFSSRVTLGNIDHIPTGDGQKVAIAQRGSFNIWDFAKLEGTARLKWPETVAGFTFKTGLFSRDGKLFAASFENPVAGGRAVVWDMATQKVVHDFANKQGGLTMLAFADDNKTLFATGKQASTVCVWKLDDRKEDGEIHFIRGLQFSNMGAMAASPDGSLVALGLVPFGGNNEAYRPIELFDVEKRARIGGSGLPGLARPVTALAFSRDGRRLAAGDQFGAVRVWQRK